MQQTRSNPVPDAAAGYRIDDLTIDLGRRRVMRGPVELPLSQLSLDLLCTLAAAAPGVRSFDQLMEEVWPGLVVSQETVSQRVKLVRDALGDDPHAPRYIGGVRGRGYRMLAQATPLSDDALAIHLSTASPPARSDPDADAALSPSNDCAPRWDSADSCANDAEVFHSRSPRRALLIGAAAMLVLLASGVVASLVHTFAIGHRMSFGSSVLVQAPKTIAVLPLIDLSPGGGNEYLGDGLSEELSSRLARIPGLRVASRTSAFAFKDRRVDVRSIAQSLGVRHVLEGSVLRQGDRLRVSAQLIDADTGYNVWSQNYDRHWRDLLGIEDDLARSIVHALELLLSDNSAGRFAQAPTTHLEAYDLYLGGLAKLRKPMSAAQLSEAEGAFRQALAVDRHFALGYAGLCETYTLGFNRTRDVALVKQAEAACHEALALDGSLLDVETALANLYLASGRASEAATIFRTAIHRDPTNADGYIGLARAYERQQQPVEAAATYQQAIDVEPGYWAAYSALGGFLFKQGHPAQAATQYERVTQLTPANASGFNNLGAALEMDGDLVGAAHAFERSLALEPARSAYSNTGTMYYFLGRFADAAQMFRKAAEFAAEDHRVWGNLADALYQLPASRPEAVGHYRHAIQLAERELRVDPRDGLDWAQLAYYHARVGESVLARQYATRALNSNTDAMYVHYYCALVAMSVGDAAAALEALHRAVNAGFPRHLIRAAPEFASLHGDERFTAWVERVSETTAPQRP